MGKFEVIKTALSKRALLIAEYKHIIFPTIFGILVFTALATKFFTHGANKGVVAVGLMGVMLILSSVIIFIENRKDLYYLIFVTCFAAFLLLAYIVVYFTGGGHTSFFGFAFQQTTLIAIASYFSAFLIGCVLSRGVHNYITNMLLALQASLVGILAVYFLQFVLGHTPSFIESEQVVSSILLLGIGFILGVQLLFVKSISRHVLLALSLMVILYAVIIFISGLVMLLISVGLGGLTIVLYEYIQIRKQNKKIKYTIIFGAVLTSLVMLFGVINLPGLMELGSTFTQQEIRPSSLATLYAGLNTFNANPIQYISGTGAHSFSFVWNSYMPDMAVQSRFWDTDFSYGFSFMATILIEFGVPLFVVINVGLVLLISSFLYTRVNFTGLHVSLAFSMFWMWVFVPDTLFILVTMILAGLLAGKVIVTSETNVPRKFNGIAIVLTFMVGVFIISSSISNFRALHSYDLGLKELKLSSQDPTYWEVGQLFTKSIEFFETPEVLTALVRLKVKYAQNLLKESGLENEEEAIIDLIDSALIYADRVRKFDSNNYRSYVTHAETLLFKGLVNGDSELIDKALITYLNASAQAYKRILPVYLNAQALVASGRYTEAEEAIEILINKYPEFNLIKELQKTLETREEQ